MAKKNDQKVVIITGMHRSGTSLIASILQSGGLNIGTHLQGPGYGNLRGHFEDKTFQEFHEKLLRRNKESWLTKKPLQNPNFNASETKSAKAIITTKSSKSVWGWKDPRTSLFLEPWQKILGNKARFIFVYRHPAEVVLSLMKREHHEILINPLLGLKTWQIYNQSILDFCKNHPEVSALINISAITDNFDQLKTILTKKLEIKLDFNSTDEIYAPGELNQLTFTESTSATFDKISPDSQAIFNELESLADLKVKPNKKAATQQDQQLNKLEELIKNLQKQNLFRSEAQSDIFSLFLNLMSADIILPTKRALAHLGQKQKRPIVAPDSSKELSHLEAQLTQEHERFDTLTNQITVELEAKSKQIYLLKQQLIDQKNYILQLEEQNQQKIKDITALEQSLNDQTSQITALEASEKITLKRLKIAEELYKHNEGLARENKSQLSKKDSHINWLEQELETLNNSLSLKVGRKLYPLRRLGEKVTGNKSNGQH
ncbi:MAG: sulfotransferase [Anaerolineae bacterium]